jgi:class 3 adenylate cyclase
MAHGDAQRAVRAGLRLIDAVAWVGAASGALAVRIGIHTGLVVVGEVGSGSAQEQLAPGADTTIRCRPM